MGGANQIAMPSGSGYGDPYYLREREREQRERERERERMGDRDRERAGDPRERDRERDREREREIRDRERERERERGDPRERGDLRDRDLRERDPRERDLRERDMRERERERERDRLTDQRDPKRLKSERMKTDRPDPFSPNIAPGPGSHHMGPGGSGPTPKLPPPPSSQGPAAAAAAAAAGGMGPGLPPPPSLHSGLPYGTTGPGGSSQHGGGDNSNANNSLGLIPLNTSGASSGQPGPGSALGPVGGGGGLPLSGAAATATGAATNFPEEFDVHNISPEFKKEGSDWFAIFNPKVKRVLDVSLVHTLMHERYVHTLLWLVIGRGLMVVLFLI